MAKIINGKEVSKKVRESVKAETEKLKAQGIVPGLAVVIVGDDAVLFFAIPCSFKEFFSAEVIFS